MRDLRARLLLPSLKGWLPMDGIKAGPGRITGGDGAAASRNRGRTSTTLFEAERRPVPLTESLLSLWPVAAP